MTTGKKIALIFGIIILFFIFSGAAVYYFWWGGFSKKTKYENCVRDCKELMFTATGQAACDERCQEVVGHIPDEKNQNQKTAPDTSSAKKEDSASKEEVINPEDKEYYCDWTWPQIIIDKNTREKIKSCTSAYPWCNFEKTSYEEIGCCKEKEHINCITLPDLLNK